MMSPVKPAAAVEGFSRLRGKYFEPLVFSLLIAKAAIVLVWLAMAIPVRGDLSFPEGALVARAADVAAGDSPYHDWRQWPHAFAPYGPLTYYVPGLLARAVDTRADLFPIYIVGRLVSAAALLGIFVIGAAIVFRMTSSWVWAAVSVALMTQWETFLSYTISYRPDAPQVFLSLCALSMAIFSRVTLPRAILAWVLISLAWWFKALSVATPIVVLVWSVQDLPRRRGWALAAAILVANLAAVFIVNSLSGGLLLLNVLGSLDNGFDLANWARLLRAAPWVNIVLLIAGLGFSVAIMRRPGENQSARRLALATVLASCSSLMAYLKVGADINYLLEPVIFSALVSTLLLWRLWSAAARQVRDSPRPGRDLSLAALLLAGLWVTAPGLVTTRDDLTALARRWRPAPLERIVRDDPGPVLAFTPYLSLAARDRSVVLDYFQFRVLAQRGKLDPSSLHERVANGDFSLVIVEGSQEVVSEDYFTPQFGRLLRARYVNVNLDSSIAIFAPRDTAERPSDP